MALLRTLTLALALAPALAAATARQGQGGESVAAAAVAANPVRKVVTMLQTMQKKVQEEGEKEEELYEKYMCYCKNSGGDLKESIAAAETKMPNVGSDIKEGEAQAEQLKEELKQHQTDRTAAKEAMDEATAIREKEAADFAAEDAEAKSNIAAVRQAAHLIEKGMAGFLQTNTAAALRRVVNNRRSMLDADRESILAFLSGGQSSSYVPVSGEVVGILKELGDQMERDLAAVTETENTAIKNYEELMAAKKKEVAAATVAIEKKTARQGTLAVEIVQMKNDLSDTERALLEDQQFLADLEKTCSTKSEEWEEIKKTRAEELVAIAETIKVLNDDDALELFKKTLPSAASASLVQVRTSAAAVRERALTVLRAAADKFDRPRIDFIALALHGKQVGFEKVIGMIDAMVETLKKEQVDDDNKRESCTGQMDSADDRKKDLERESSDLETSIADLESSLATVEDEIKTLQEGIAQLDKDVAEATEQRKAAHEDYLELAASDSAAKDLLKFAINRLNKFYNPKLYKPPAKRELTEEERITKNMGGTLAPTAAPGGIAGTGISVSFAQVAQRRGVEAPPPPPEIFDAYSKKSEEGTGVIAMINLLIKDLEKELAEAGTMEEAAQADYEKLMKDSAEKRSSDTKELTDKTAAKANLEMDLETARESKESTDKELGAVMQTIASLHAECDWLLKFFDVRKEARASEIDSLQKAKAVLNGADFSLAQVRTHRFLGRA